MPLPQNLRALVFALVLLPGLAEGQEAGLPFRQAIGARVQAAGKSPVVPGVAPWLFLGSELRFLSVETFWGPEAAKVSRAPKPEFADPLAAIVDFQQGLKARGVELLLVPVPPKAAIYPGALSPEFASAPAEVTLAPLQRFYRELAAQGVEVLDLAPAFLAQAAVPSAVELYCHTDTHWSPAGCEQAAALMAQRVREKLGGTAPAGVYTGTKSEVELEGDLVALLPAKGPKPAREKLPLVQIKRSVDGAPVVADPASPVLVLGDSHTLVFHDFAAERAGLLDQLALQLGAAPDLIGTRGSGSTAVRLSLYRKTIKDPTYLAKKKIVVWCFTAREFTESDQGWQKLPVSK